MRSENAKQEEANEPYWLDWNNRRPKCTIIGEKSQLKTVTFSSLHSLDRIAGNPFDCCVFFCERSGEALCLSRSIWAICLRVDAP
jgi:hypothetical protein